MSNERTPRDLPSAPSGYEQRNEQALREAITTMFRNILRPLRKYAVTPHSTIDTSGRTYDANTATAADTNAMLAQLISDLKERGTIE